MDPQFGIMLDEATALELYEMLSREYVSPATYPKVTELVRKLRELKMVHKTDGDTSVM